MEENTNNINEYVVDNDKTEEIEIVEAVDATENKEDEHEEVKNDESVNDKDLDDKSLDITAGANIPYNSTEDTTNISQDGDKKVEDVPETSNYTNEQFDAMIKEIESLKSKVKLFEEDNEKLRKDIASLRENPFYKSTNTTNDRPMRGADEYSKEDVERMRRRI